MAITNLERVLNQLRRWGRGFFDGAVAQQAKEAAAVLERAKVYVPVDTGALRASGRTNAEIRELHLASAEVRFGGADSQAPYALIVHENLEVYHAPPTQAKYLERAVNELQPGMALRIGYGGVAAAKRRAGTR